MEDQVSQRSGEPLQYFTHVINGREYRAWFFSYDGSLTVVCNNRARMRELGDLAPETLARVLLEELAGQE